MPDTHKLDLDEASLEIVTGILEQHLPQRPVFAFGSRTRGNARRRSDLDLIVGGTDPIDFQKLSEIGGAFSESDLPIFVDVIDMHSIDRGFLERIQPYFVPVVRGER